MLVKTHQAFGIFTSALLLVDYLHTPILSVSGVLGIGAAMITSIMPDTDEPNSVPAKAMFPLAMLWEFLKITHRGFTHSVFVTVWWFVLAMAGRHWVLHVGAIHVALFPVLLSAAVGYLSHIVIDLPNKKGEQLLWPLKWRFAFHLVDSNGFANAALEVIFLIGSFFVIVYGLGIEYPAVGAIFKALHHFTSLIPLT